MVVYKNFGIIAKPGAQIKGFAVIPLSEALFYIPYIAEIGNHGIVNKSVLVRLNVGCLTAGTDYLQVCRRPFAGFFRSFSKYGIDVVITHVLGGINTEAVDPHFHQTCQVISNLALGIRIVSGNIRHTGKGASSYIICIRITVINLTVSMEVAS